LTCLGLSENNITDITPLSNLINLTCLGLSENNITDITPLSHLSKLTYLNLKNNKIPGSDRIWLQNQLPNCKIDY
ncbi:leucine-rich repeat domain-containing protein, partial [Pasteurellaceae bacterium LIM206]|nr:leucine-rich repeat domain-containing protein [Pasteurellaceae bacterium LIM206]